MAPTRTKKHFSHVEIEQILAQARPCPFAPSHRPTVPTDQPTLDASPDPQVSVADQAPSTSSKDAASVSSSSGGTQDSFDSLGPIIRQLHDQGNEDVFLRSLSKFVEDKEGEIEKICGENYQVRLHRAASEERADLVLTHARTLSPPSRPFSRYDKGPFICGIASASSTAR